MAGCCGGKNSKKRISRFRYLLGACLFAGYHGLVQVMLLFAALVKPGKFRALGAFHRSYFASLLKEIAEQDGISVGKHREDGCENE